jgi:hypothetical protein
VLVAGVGAMSFLRSSFYSVRLGETDVQIGPGNLLKTILDAADREVDRKRARERATLVTTVMGPSQDGKLGPVSFAKAQLALPALCFALVQNLSEADQEAAAAEIAALANAPMPDEVRARLLGLSLINVVGDGVLVEAVATLGAEIRIVPFPALAPAAAAPPAAAEIAVQP